MLLQPGLQGARGLPRGRLGPGRVSVRVLAVRVEALSGVDRQGGWVGARALLQLVLGALKCDWRERGQLVERLILNFFPPETSEDALKMTFELLFKEQKKFLKV